VELRLEEACLKEMEEACLKEMRQTGVGVLQMLVA
jgi:hypothetical protein